MALWPSGDNPIYEHTKSTFPVLRIKNMVNNSRPAHAAQRASAPTKRPVNKYATIVAQIYTMVCTYINKFLSELHIYAKHNIEICQRYIHIHGLC